MPHIRVGHFSSQAVLAGLIRSDQWKAPCGGGGRERPSVGEYQKESLASAEEYWFVNKDW